MSQTLLDVKNIKIQFNTEEGLFNAVNGISFSVQKGETIGIVGESGCGKSITSLSIMRLIPSPPGKIIEGEINYKGRDLLKLSDKEMRKIRGNDIAMIFQEPMTSLNPVYTVGEQIAEVIQLHQSQKKKQAIQKAVELLKLVGIPEAERRVREYPHQLSGGMRQRVMIAMALACNPELLIADEPTTALDVTIQAQILDLMKEMKDKLGMSIIFITHDLGVVSEVADTVMVMYAGEVVEKTSSEEIFKYPMHPYTQGLINSVPDVNDDRENLEAISGVLPHFSKLPEGCRFSTRCPIATDLCREKRPELQEHEQGHLVRCWQYSDLWEEGERNNGRNQRATVNS
jgi:peptide/nickel transport system ATP-binding protein